MTNTNWTICRRSALGGNVSPFASSYGVGTEGSGESTHTTTTGVGRTKGVSWSLEAYHESLALYQRFIACTDSYVAPLINEALRVLEHAYRLHGPESVVCSYNGGKDAVVIMHLMRAAHAHWISTQLPTEEGLEANDDALGTSNIMIRPRVIYFEHEDEFPEVEKLLRDTVRQFDLQMVAFEKGIGYTDGLELLTTNNYHEEEEELDSSMISTSTSKYGKRRRPPHPMAFILGTRSGDPNAGNQSHWAPSSHYLCPFMRVNPIIKWTYGEIWHLLRLFQLPYCSLYDQGYTSLGTTKDSVPCPALAKSGGGQISAKDCGGVRRSCNYWPAYMLRDWEMERAGRKMKPKKPPQHTISESSSTVSLASKIQENDNVEEDSVTSSPDQKTVGLVIIGDEILKGLTADTNTFSAAVALRENNVPLTRVSVVSDDFEEISTEIRRMQLLCDAVITSGGVGPTHDDITIKSVAQALGDELVLHEEMWELLLKKMGQSSDESARLKMSTLPKNSKLRYMTDDPDEWPVLQCSNIFILPGVPKFFEEKVKALSVHLLSTDLEKSIFYRVVLSCEEARIVDPLNDVVRRHPAVSFGSYPFVDHPQCKTVVTLEGRLIDGGYAHTSGRFLKQTNLSMSSSSNVNDKEESPNSIRRKSLPPADLLNSKQQMDLNVERALSDLLEELPNDSVLRVEENVSSLR